VVGEYNQPDNQVMFNLSFPVKIVLSEEYSPPIPVGYLVLLAAVPRQNRRGFPQGFQLLPWHDRHLCPEPSE